MIQKVFNWIGTGMVAEVTTASSVFAWIVGVLVTALAVVGIIATIKFIAKKVKENKTPAKRR